MSWFHKPTCSICGVEFRRRKVAFPSLVGYSYCSPACEATAWQRWIEGTHA